MLHITNGDSVTGTFAVAELPGEYLSWLDVLHEGPVPRTETLEELSEIRARFVADCEWTTYEGALETFRHRDELLVQSHQQDEVVLWFEHDLFDQLQLNQILDWYYRHPDKKPPLLRLIHPRTHLGSVPPDVFLGIFPVRQDIHPQQLELGHRAWQAFLDDTPVKLVELLRADLDPLPYMHNNVTRLLEEYPSRENGLSRSQQQILETVAAGYSSREDVFNWANDREDDVFMGDWSAYRIMDEFVAKGVLTELDGLAISDSGKKLLANEADYLRDFGGIDHWIGGTHLKGADTEWRWDRAQKRIVNMNHPEELVGEVPLQQVVEPVPLQNLDGHVKQSGE